MLDLLYYWTFMAETQGILHGITHAALNINTFTLITPLSFDTDYLII